MKNIGRVSQRVTYLSPQTTCRTKPSNAILMPADTAHQAASDGGNGYSKSAQTVADNNELRLSTVGPDTVEPGSSRRLGQPASD